LSKIVPAVTDVFRAQPAQTQKRPSPVGQPRRSPHAAQAIPSGQRSRSRYRAQATSSGNQARNSAHVPGYFAASTLDPDGVITAAQASCG
jgi:hypothetical protein